MSDSAHSRRLTSDHIVSGAAIFISLCTLVVLLYEARILREQQRAAVWPYIEIGMGFGDSGFAVRTWNQGVGPALVRSMEVRVDDTPVPTWADWFEALEIAPAGYSTDKTNGRVLTPQSTLASLAVQGDDSTSTRVYRAYSDGRLTFELCYCSVYDECWRVQAQGLDEERERVDACATDSATAFTL